ncbi:insulin-induced protein-domain-containing protein [Xylaria arbuscula]|nr:insulin-induced protein-domain-containing protein [Xylaria arbuscula]
MTDSPNGPPLLRPIPVRPFNLNNLNNHRAPSPPPQESPSQLPHSGSSLNLDWLNFKLLNSRSRMRSESSTSISRAQSVMNLTSSTLMGIYEPTTYDSDKYTPGVELSTPWGAGAETPARVLSMDEPLSMPQKGRLYPVRRRSSAQHSIHTPPLSTTTSLFYSSLRALLLSGLGVLYGIGVATVRGDRSTPAFRVDHVINASKYSWSYMAFWAASGLTLGCLLPWIDGIWDAPTGEGNSGEAIETEGDSGKKLRRKTDWALAVRGIGIFIGIAYAIRKLQWDSTLQLSLCLALVNPALWFLIDGSMPGFIVSSAVGLTGSALLTSLQPDMIPVPAMLSSSPHGGLYGTGPVHSNASSYYAGTETMFLGGFANQQTFAMGIWTLNVLFCCCVVFGNVGRWLAINKYGSPEKHQGPQGFYAHYCSSTRRWMTGIEMVPVRLGRGPSPSAPSEDDGPPPISPLDDRDNIPGSASAGIERPRTSVDYLLDATRDARRIIRLIQCQLCHKVLEDPTTLPCGYSICGTCLPETRLRANISWPATESRLQGFDCPFADCGKEHAAADCTLDITLSKVLAVVKTAVASYQPAAQLSEYSTHITVCDQWGVTGIPSLVDKHPESRVLNGGRITAAYTLVELGKLEYSSEVSYSSVGATDDELSNLDGELFLKLKEMVRAEMDCQVCYALFLDPMTTTCGHTYCRTCIHRILDHSDLCPICRRAISVQPQASPRTAPSNRRLVSMINGFWSDLVALRSQAYRLEQQANHDGFDVPIFVCTLSFPSMPLFLHVFEPRYRLMIRRAVESDRTFGMVLGKTAPGPGEPAFMELGVLLRIVNIEFFPDGRSLLETIGVSRFRITRHGLLDGYIVANIEKIDDISLAEEERLEAFELSQESDITVLEARNPTPGLVDMEPSSAARSSSISLSDGDLDSMSTRELLNYGADFVRRMQAESVHWLTARMLSIYGESPDDPAIFPWWLACVFPVSDAEKYRLLGSSSVREQWEASRVSLPSA